MTITAEQLDELERKAKRATPGPWQWGRPVEGSAGALEHLRALFAPNRAALRLPVVVLDADSLHLTMNDDTDHIAANSPDVTLQLVAIAQAALAWNEARRAVVAAHESYEDSGLIAPLNLARAAFDLTETALVDALRGTP